jgi:hypothetical protein
MSEIFMNYFQCKENTKEKGKGNLLMKAIKNPLYMCSASHVIDKLPNSEALDLYACLLFFLNIV